jgi:hypothetical protein
VEPKLAPSIGVVEDPALGCSGPLYVKGGIRIESENGLPYEVRNRVTPVSLRGLVEQAVLQRHSREQKVQGRARRVRASQVSHLPVQRTKCPGGGAMTLCIANAHIFARLAELANFENCSLHPGRNH